MKPFFSVIIPVYNVEKYLDDCFSSLESQKFKDFEMIFVNDGATDSSGFLCNNFCSKHNNAITIHKENGGLSDARNKGIKVANGKYIILLDSDDMLDENSLYNLHKLILNKKNPDIILNRIKSFEGTVDNSTECKYHFSNDLYLLDSADIFKKIIKMDDYVPGAWTIVAKKDYLEKNNLFFVENLLHEDEQWTPRVILKADSIAFNNDCFYLYRVSREGSITQVKNVKRELDKLWTVRDFINNKSNEYDRKANKALIGRATDLYWGVLSRSHQYKSNQEEYMKLIKELSLLKRVLKNNGGNIKYSLCRVTILLFGVKYTSRLMGVLLNFKNI